MKTNLAKLRMYSRHSGCHVEGLIQIPVCYYSSVFVMFSKYLITCEAVPVRELQFVAVFYLSLQFLVLVTDFKAFLLV